MKKIIVLTLGLRLLSPALHAQSYAVDWHKIAGGGGFSAGTNGATVFSVTGTVGQHDAGPAMTGGSYAVTGGFWSLISVVATVGAPALAITHLDGSVQISWPSSPDGFSLQQSSSLASASWTKSGYIVTTNSAVESITLPSPTGTLFFRLKQP